MPHSLEVPLARQGQLVAGSREPSLGRWRRSLRRARSRRTPACSTSVREHDWARNPEGAERNWTHRNLSPLHAFCSQTSSICISRRVEPTLCQKLHHHPRTTNTPRNRPASQVSYPDASRQVLSPSARQVQPGKRIMLSPRF